MTALRHVVAATDLGPASARVLPLAADIAAAFRARLTLLHVVEPSSWVDHEVSPERRREAQARAEAAAAHLRGVADVDVAVFSGEAAEEIPYAAASMGADLLVVGTHGRRGISRAVLGSVAARLIRSSTVPVLSVHPWWHEDRRRAGVALASAFSRELAGRVVLATSRGAAIVAAEVAKAHGRDVDLLLTGPLAKDSGVHGGVCEDGTARFDPMDASGAGDRARATGPALEALREEALRLRGTPWIGDTWRRDVVLVCDAVDEPWSLLAAADVLLELGASSIVVATPVVTRRAREVLARELDGVFALHDLDDGADAASIYEDASTPTDAAVAACLRAEPSPAAAAISG